MPSDWERVAADPALLAAARAAYSGRGDLADQLWWLDHPGTAGPTGAQDPGPALEVARAALYRPDGSHELDADAVRRDLALLAADRDAARVAVRTALAQRTTAVGGSPRRAERGGAGAVLGAALAALLVGAATGFALGRFGGPPAPAALRIFTSTQQQRDLPPRDATLPPFAARSAYRLIDSSPSTGAFAYGMRTRGGEVCLVVVVLARAAYSTCTSEAAFAVGGLTLALSVNVDPQDDSGAARPVTIRPHWAPDGGFSF